MWTKLDDGFYDHPKVLRCGLEAIGLYALGLSYAARHLTDGAIPLGFVGKRKRLAEELVEVGLWERDGSSYRIHHFLDYNPSASRVRGERRAARVRMNKVRTQREVRPNASGNSSSPSRTRPEDEREKAFIDDAQDNGARELNDEERPLVHAWIRSIAREQDPQKRDKLTRVAIGELRWHLKLPEHRVRELMEREALDMDGRPEAVRAEGGAR